MGTPEFAVPSLRKLASSPDHHITGVVTVPDRQKGRGLKVLASPVKTSALDLNLPVVQPEVLDDPGFIGQLTGWNADCFVVVGFRILPPEVFELPPGGCFNLHASLLPKYRGAAPIQWALIRGEKKTGVTTFLIRRTVDTGDILMQDETEIGENENAGSLHDRLAVIGAGLVLRTVDALESGKLTPRIQHGDPTSAPKITQETGRIDWNASAGQIRNLIRGLSPYPGAYGFLNGRRFKIYEAEILSQEDGADAGKIIKSEGGQLIVQTGSGCILVKTCQIEGKNRMDAAAFLRGVAPGSLDRFDIIKRI